MTDVRVPETDPFESAAPERPPASPGAGSFGTGGFSILGV